MSGMKRWAIILVTSTSPVWIGLIVAWLIWCLWLSPTRAQPSIVENQSAGSLTIIDPKAYSLTFSANNTTVLRITPKGELILGDGYTPSAAGEAFIEFLRPQLKAMMECPK